MQLRFAVPGAVLASLLLASPSIISLAAAPPASAASATPREEMGATHRFPSTGGAYTSANWGGYVTSAAAPFTGVQSRWVQPAVTCDGYGEGEGFWIGLDGWSNSTVEQVGVAVQCLNPTGQQWFAQYWAFWEMYPTTAAYEMFQIKAGDTVQPSVIYNGTAYALSFKDITSGQSFTEHKPCGAGAAARGVRRNGSSRRRRHSVAPVCSPPSARSSSASTRRARQRAAVP